MTNIFYYYIKVFFINNHKEIRLNSIYFYHISDYLGLSFYYPPNDFLFYDCEL